MSRKTISDDEKASSVFRRVEPARLPQRWRRGQWLEIDHKEIARRNTQLERDKFDYHLATPLLATPGEALGESIDLIVVATGKREQLSDEFFQPPCAPGKTDRSSGEQIGWAINRARLSVSGL